jgi:hypothetical protein
MGLRFLTLQGGGGSEEWAIALLVRTPCRKIRARFLECKHILLGFMKGKFCELPLYGVLGCLLVGTEKSTNSQKSLLWGCASAR